MEATINIACKYIEFTKISLPDNIKQDRTKDDVINTCLEFAEKINENKHLLDEMVPFFENVNEDELYINLIIYCKEEIRKLHGKIVFDNFEEAEIIKTMKLVEIEGFSIAQYNPCNETLTKQTETKAEQANPLKLSDIFDSLSKYKFVMNLLIEKQYCQPNTYIWKDEGAGNKGLLVAILKHLHAQGYYKDNKRPTNKQIKEIAQNTFGWEMSIDTIKKAKPTQFNVSFILPA